MGNWESPGEAISRRESPWEEISPQEEGISQRLRYLLQRKAPHAEKKAPRGDILLKEGGGGNGAEKSKSRHADKFHVRLFSL